MAAVQHRTTGMADELKLVPRQVLEVRVGFWLAVTQRGLHARMRHAGSPGPPRPSAQDYVQGRIREFSSVFAEELVGAEAASGPLVANVFQQASTRVSAARLLAESPIQDKLLLRLVHVCKFRGCKSKDCALCINNPNKRCGADSQFAECFADNQVMRSPCDADVCIQLVSLATGEPVAINGVEVVVSAAALHAC
jgi:hypothetical protein